MKQMFQSPPTSKLFPKNIRNHNTTAPAIPPYAVGPVRQKALGIDPPAQSLRRSDGRGFPTRWEGGQGEHWFFVTGPITMVTQTI